MTAYSLVNPVLAKAQSVKTVTKIIEKTTIKETVKETVRAVGGALGKSIKKLPETGLSTGYWIAALAFIVAGIVLFTIEKRQAKEK